MKRTAFIAAMATGIIVLLLTGLPATAARLITGSDIKNGSITRQDVRKGTLTLDRLSTPTQALIRRGGATGPAGPRGATGARGPAGARGATGARGTTGPRGATGPAGPAGPAGVSGYQVVPGTSVATPSASQTFTVSCPAGKVVLGGGGQAVAGTDAAVTASIPVGTSTWSVTATATAASGLQVTAYAICANVTA